MRQVVGGRIGIFGGAFDPIHRGHLSLIDSMMASGVLDEMALVPTFAPPHRETARHGFDDRVAMARLAVESRPDVRVLTVEADLPEPSYTVRTLEYLKAEDPSRTLFLCLGYDSLATFHRWHRYGDILGMCTLLVASRPGADTAVPRAEVLERTVFVDHEPVAISSTQVREALASSRDARGLVPDPVLDYLRTLRS